MSQPIKKIKIPPFFIVDTIYKIRNALIAISRKMTPPNMGIMELTQGFWIAKAIGTASSLGIADLLEDKPEPIENIAQLTGTHPEFLYRIMRMLASQGIFKEEKGHVFTNTPLSRTLLDNPFSMKYMVEHQTSTNSWSLIGAMDKSLMSGKSADKLVFGETVFAHLSKNPEMNSLYNKAMSNSSVLIASTILRAYSFSSFKKIIDLGGGHGILLNEILLKNEHLEGVVFDLPHVIDDLQFRAQHNYSKMLSFQSGDIFNSVPTADGYILKNVFHVFDDPDCIIILNKIYQAAEENARILIIEPLIGKPNRPTFGKLFDILLMVGTEGGRERTREEYISMLKGSKLKFKRIINTVSPFSIIEAIKT